MIKLKDLLQSQKNRSNAQHHVDLFSKIIKQYIEINTIKSVYYIESLDHNDDSLCSKYRDLINMLL